MGGSSRATSREPIEAALFSYNRCDYNPLFSCSPVLPSYAFIQMFQFQPGRPWLNFFIITPTQRADANEYKGSQFSARLVCEKR
jgi:hypothetical protein